MNDKSLKESFASAVAGIVVWTGIVILAIACLGFSFFFFGEVLKFLFWEWSK